MSERKLTPPPGAVYELAERTVEQVRRVVGIGLDYTPETLPLLDHYLVGVPDEQIETVALVAATAGAYFGEVLRKALGGEWGSTEGTDPTEWELVLESGVRLAPGAFAREAILTTETSEAFYDVPEPQRAAVEDALTAKGEVPEDEYYSLCGRLETLLLIEDVVAASRLTRS